MPLEDDEQQLCDNLAVQLIKACIQDNRSSLWAAALSRGGNPLPRKFSPAHFTHGTKHTRKGSIKTHLTRTLAK